VSRFDLVIFDCDGVLVDSEHLNIRTEAAILARLGWPISQSEIINRFVGRSAAYMQHEIEQRLGRAIDWDAEFEVPCLEVFERELTAVPGVVAALDRITTQTCVASSGSHDRMPFTLGITGLLDRFEGRIFSTSEVDHGKPAPDIFLHAATRMGVPPSRCAVVEDSVAGVTAGLAATMTVFAFTGGVTDAAQLAGGGAVVFDDMSLLPDLLRG
jgi:HAD superfamily hydrolase (TIGR01509 family)